MAEKKGGGGRGEREEEAEDDEEDDEGDDDGGGRQNSDGTHEPGRVAMMKLLVRAYVRWHCHSALASLKVPSIIV